MIDKPVIDKLEEDVAFTPSFNRSGLEFEFSVQALKSAPVAGRTELGWGEQSGPLGLYGIYLVTGGAGRCLIDAESIELCPNQVGFVLPNQRISWSVDHALEGFELLFSEGFLTLNEIRPHRLPGSALFDPARQRNWYGLEDDDASRAVQIAGDMKAEFELKRPAYFTALRSLLVVLLLHLWRGCDQVGTKSEGGSGAGPSNDLVNRYLRMVVEEPRLDRTVTHYARQLNVSASHLHELVKEATGLTPISIIQREVILEAKRRLIYTTHQVADIAESLAFKDASYFGRYFRRNTGTTPGAFRRQSRNSLGLEST